MSTKKMNFSVFLLISCVCAISPSQCAKILGVFPVPARSHYILGSSLMKGLAEKGHDVTMICAFEEKNPPKNGSYKNIQLKDLLEENDRRMKEMNFYERGETNTFLMLPVYVKMGYGLTEYTLKDPKVQQLLESDEKFDAVIIEQFLIDGTKGFASHFKAPLILFSPIGANTGVNMLVGNPGSPSYVADALLSYSSDMTLWERTVNTLFQGASLATYHFFSFPLQKQLYDTYFPGSDPFYDVLYNNSLVLLNSHVSFNQPVPFVPNMIDIGGFHVKPTGHLPPDLQKYLDDSKEGLVYFSMGSNLKGVQLPAEKRDAFLKTFSKLKQNVLWKWEEENLPGKLENVKIGKWLPQQEILAHPNVKLFITHGGLLSTTETVYHGVPVLAIPVMGDQKMNAQSIVNAGFGLTLTLKEVNEVTLTEKLMEILSNPKYGLNAKRRSQIFHDRMVKPMDTAIYWIEYVIRHKGAPHLKVTGVDLPWYQYFLLDVFVFFVVLFYIVVKGVKYTVSRCFCKKTKLKQQ